MELPFPWGMGLLGPPAPRLPWPWEAKECLGAAARGLPERSQLIPAPRAGREEWPCAEISLHSFN